MRAKLINEDIEYGCYSCGTFISANELLNAIKFEGEVYFRLKPEFPDYFISESLKVLSARVGGRVKRLKPQNVASSPSLSDKYRNPCYVVVIADTNGVRRTRTLATLWRSIQAERN